MNEMIVRSSVEVDVIDAEFRRIDRQAVGTGGHWTAVLMALVFGALAVFLAICRQYELAAVITFCLVFSLAVYAWAEAWSPGKWGEQ